MQDRLEAALARFADMPEVEEWMWRRLKLMARAWFRKAPVGLVLERLGSADGGGEPDSIRTNSGSSTVTLAAVWTSAMA